MQTRPSHIARPTSTGEHRSVFTPFLVFLMAITYAFMAGAYLTEGDGDSPHALHKYIINNAQFDARFLTTWGALHGPETFHQVYRLITYGLLHQSAIHCLSNLVVITTFGVHDGAQVRVSGVSLSCGW